MKHFLSIGAGATLLAIGMILGATFALWLDNDSCLQQQAGYQVALTSQTKMLTTQIDLLAKEKARAGLLQAAHTALQQEFASTLAARVGKIDDVMEGPEAIAVLAKRLDPVEKAVKKVAEVEDGFLPVPWIKQQIVNGAKMAGVRWK